MKTALTMLAAAIVAAAPACAQDAQDARGTWSGTIANQLTVHVDVSKGANGAWQAILSSPTQGFKMSVEKLVIAGDRMSFELGKLQASFAATWNAQDQAWMGTWTQGSSVPLVLKRIDSKAVAAMQPKRPQEAAIAAATAAPYSTAEVQFDNSVAKLSLAGSLTLPQGKGPFPAVVLIHGSGALDRDATLFGHQPFLVWADYLARQGIAVLRYDKRGVGKSDGNIKQATSLDLAGDAEAAVRMLRARPDIDARRIGLLGHSEGGLIAPLLATRDADLAFVVMLAGPGVVGHALLTEQLSQTARAQGQADAEAEQSRKLNAELFAAIAAAPTLDQATSAAKRVLDSAEQRGAIPAGAGAAMLARLATPWFHTFLAYDPTPVLAKLRQPVLALNGTLDLQVTASQNLPAIRTALKDNPRATVLELAKLNHLMQTASTGSGLEYSTIEESVAPVALDTVGQWIRTTLQAGVK